MMHTKIISQSTQMSDMVDNDFVQQWTNVMDPDRLKPNLELIALYITLYEMLEDTIINKPRDFFTFVDELDEESYSGEVLSLFEPDRCPLIRKSSKVLISSLLWWRKLDAITDEDIEVYSKCKIRRNALTHEMFASLAKGLDDAFMEDFSKMYNLFCKMERWWILEIEIPTNPDFDDKDPADIDTDGVMSGNMLVLSMVFDIVTSGSKNYYESACQKFKEFRKT